MSNQDLDLSRLKSDTEESKSYPFKGTVRLGDKGGGITPLS